MSPKGYFQDNQEQTLSSTFIFVQGETKLGACPENPSKGLVPEPLKNPELLFTDLFNVEELQVLQDAFSAATRVASIITHPDGTPITRPSNFCRLCMDIIRGTPKGCANCFHSDSIIGRYRPDGPTIQPCLSGGLWDAGASITVGGRHVANWLIGQVKNEYTDEQELLAYAREIGADEQEFRRALREVPVMSLEQFQSIARLAFLLANDLSLKAYQNLQQAQLMAERKRAEEAMLRSEKLAAVGRMAATISHEINNPLAAVMNTLFLVRESAELSKSAQHYLDIADAELRRIAHITRQSLGFYRESTAPTTVSVSDLLASVTDLLRSKIKAKHVQVERQCSKELEVTGVTGELRQVFSNLLANSLDAVEENGQIRLRASVTPSSVRITIADNGKGIPRAAVSHIFEPFFTTKGSVGTGLGLWVTKQIIDKHRGSIQVRSRTDGLRRGTTFSVTLPADSAAPKLDTQAA